MSLFRSASFKIKKREKAARALALEKMPEDDPKKESEDSRGSLELPSGSANLLTVPDSARSAFFTLPSAGNSRSSLFSRAGAASGSSSGAQEDKPRSSFFKLSNLSKGSFVSTLRRDRESKGRNTLDILQTVEDVSGSFAHLPGELKEYGYLSSPRRPESAEVSMPNLLAGLDAPPPNSSLRQRSRTLSTKSAPDTPDDPLRLFTKLPTPGHMGSITRSSAETPVKRRLHMSVPPKLSLDTFVSSSSDSGTSSLPSPLLAALSFSPGRLDDILPPLPAESLGSSKLELHSPAPTIISATSSSTIQDSLMTSYDMSSSESEPDLGFLPGEDDCGTLDASISTIRRDSLIARYASGSASTEITPQRARATPYNRTASLDVPSQWAPSSLSGSRASLDNFSPSPHSPLATSFDTEELDSPDDQITPLETVISKIKPKLVSGDRGGSTLSARRLKIRRPGGSSLTVLSDLQPRSETILEDTPPTPSTPSFLVGLAWPRPPFRRIYVDTRQPGASWHTVSNITTERLIDGSGNARVEPCHVIMLAHAIDSLSHPQVQADIHTQQPLSPTAASALALLALHSAPLVST